MKEGFRGIKTGKKGKNRRGKCKRKKPHSIMVPPRGRDPLKSQK
jgi:hypothetical protein